MEREEFELSQEVLELISGIAAEKAAEAVAGHSSRLVREYLDSCQEEEEKHFYYDEETAIKAYRDLKLAIEQEAEFSYEEKAEIRWSFMKDCMEMVGREPGSLAEKYERSIKFKQALVCKIEMGLSCMDIATARSQRSEERRKYRVLRALYIDNPGLSIPEVAKNESIIGQTVYTDLRDAIRVMMFYTGPLGFLIKPLGLRRKKRKNFSPDEKHTKNTLFTT